MRCYLKPDDFLSAAREVAEWSREREDVELLKNDLGNLSIMWYGQYVGYVDLVTGEVVMTELDRPEDGATT